MRCPPGLVFDDLYQRCEWPAGNNQSPSHRLSSLRNKKAKKQTVSMTTTLKQQNSTVSPSNKVVAEP